jgi:hypothetical protein
VNADRSTRKSYELQFENCDDEHARIVEHGVKNQSSATGRKFNK